MLFNSASIFVYCLFFVRMYVFSSMLNKVVYIMSTTVGGR